MEDFLKQRLSQIIAEAVAGQIRKHVGEHTAGDARDEHAHHHRAVAQDIAEIARLYAVIDHLLHILRQHHVHRNLQNHKQRCQQRQIPVFFQILQELYHAFFSSSIVSISLSSIPRSSPSSHVPSVRSSISFVSTKKPQISPALAFPASVRLR